jgi:hypothetical protein
MSTQVTEETPPLFLAPAKLGPHFEVFAFAVLSRSFLTIMTLLSLKFQFECHLREALPGHPI